MGKGVIVSEQGEGEYVIKVTYDLKRALIRKNTINKEKYNLDNKITDLATEISDLETEKQTAVDDMNTKIDAANTATPNNEEFSKVFKDILIAATTEITNINKILVTKSTELANLQYDQQDKKIELEKIEIAISKYEDPVPITAWCTDYTEGLLVDDVVDTIDTNDERPQRSRRYYWSGGNVGKHGHRGSLAS